MAFMHCTATDAIFSLIITWPEASGTDCGASFPSFVNAPGVGWPDFLSACSHLVLRTAKPETLLLFLGPSVDYSSGLFVALLVSASTARRVSKVTGIGNIIAAHCFMRGCLHQAGLPAEVERGYWRFQGPPTFGPDLKAIIWI